MRIEAGGREVFSADYASFDDVILGLRREEEAAGRDLPLHALSVLLGMAALWILEKAADKAFDWATETRKRWREEAEGKAAEEGAAKRHEELCGHLAAVKAVIEEARGIARQGGDIAKANRPILLPGPSLEVDLGKGSEEDLREAFNEIAQKLPTLRLEVRPPKE
jgi:hypothetical protein